MSNIIFDLKDVHYSYLGRFPALCGINMTIHAGESIGVIGANGTGKSTLLHLLDGLIFPDRGELTAFGKPLTEELLNDNQISHDFRSRVGYSNMPMSNYFALPSERTLSLGLFNLELTKEKFKSVCMKSLNY